MIVDVGGGYGGAVTLRLQGQRHRAVRLQRRRRLDRENLDRQLRFANKRAEAWWRFREALDPDQEGGSVIALPPDPQLRADLAAPIYEVGPRGILIESKDELRQAARPLAGQGRRRGDVLFGGQCGGAERVSMRNVAAGKGKYGIYRT